MIVYCNTQWRLYIFLYTSGILGTPEAQKIVSYFQELVENGKFKDKENYDCTLYVFINNHNNY